MCLFLCFRVCACYITFRLGSTAVSKTNQEIKKENICYMFVCIYIYVFNLRSIHIDSFALYTYVCIHTNDIF